MEKTKQCYLGDTFQEGLSTNHTSKAEPHNCGFCMVCQSSAATVLKFSRHRNTRKASVLLHDGGGNTVIVFLKSHLANCIKSHKNVHTPLTEKFEF